MDIKRVIAARELTIAEIEQLTAVPCAEIEVFIHGALCYAYSGLCLLSAALRGRSGNRGECAYICRRDSFAKTPSENHQSGRALLHEDLCLKD